MAGAEVNSGTVSESGIPHPTDIESVEPGGFDFLTEMNAPWVADRPRPRGLLPIPSEVEAIVARADARLLKEHGFAPTEEAQRRLVNSLTLQFYYEGFDVAYRPTHEGVEVLAVGPEEIGQLVRGMSEEVRQNIKIGQP